ncbi:hypothetical protein BC829DRAFT_361974 [Chytridium lagenaria]|nr:hypothetical protein BC829DRAFT_361974 [Chytridium lagenaria]
MFFCPTCANLLLIQVGEMGGHELFCQACPYMCTLEKVLNFFYCEHSEGKKAVDDVLGGEEALEKQDQTDVNCSKCEGTRAYYMQLQIRSADEPMTTFYTCVNCRYTWREN